MAPDDLERARAADADEDREIARDAQGFKRDLGHFYLVLLAVAVFGILVAPVVNRYLEAYQAVVVAPPEGGKVRVLMADSQVVRRPVPGDLARELKPGDYLRKRSMTWSPVEISQAQLTDEPHEENPARQPPKALPAWYQRYMSTWAGTVVDVQVRRLPTHGGALSGERRQRTTMIVAGPDGHRERLKVPDDLLGHVRPGTRLEKRARSWLPVVVAQGAPIPPAPAATDGGTADAGASGPGSPPR